MHAKRLVKGLAVGLTLTAGLIISLAWITVLPGEIISAGRPRATSVYIDMPDGTPIAADIWMPPRWDGRRLPTIIEMTRYWRGEQIGWLQRAAYGTGLIDAPNIDRTGDFMNRRGFAYILVDARGTGASGGDRPAEWSPAEIDDYAHVIAWAARQPWSNGRVGVTGVSYAANTAEMVSASGVPALHAVATRFGDFDPFIGNASPGGVFNSGFIRDWGRMNAALDRNDACALADIPRLVCPLLSAWSGGVARAGGDDGSRLARIVARRRSNNVLTALSGVAGRDVPMTQSGGLKIATISPYRYGADSAAARVPTLVLAGWMDAATADGALARYLSRPGPQQVYLGAWSHGGDHDTDPFDKGDAPDPSHARQLDLVARFFERHLNGPAAPGERYVRYFTMGERRWRTVTDWPPSNRLLSLALRSNPLHARSAEPDRSTLTLAVPARGPIAVATRWHTQADGGDVAYGPTNALPVAAQFVSAPLKERIAIVGAPALAFDLLADCADGMVTARLDALDPQGRPHYLTEGNLRLAHRAPAAPDTLPYRTTGDRHPYLASAMRPMPTQQAAPIEIALYSTAAAVPRGFRLRLSLAGAAPGLFDVAGSRCTRWQLSGLDGRTARITLPLRHGEAPNR